MGMNIFSRFLRFLGFQGDPAPIKKPHVSTPATASPAPASGDKGRTGQNISYDSTLIPKLKADHQELVRLYGEIAAACNRSDYAALPAMILALKLGLQHHLIVENVRLYAYLKQELAEDSEQASFANSVKKEMDGIARAVVRFADAYNSTEAIANNAEAFKNELDGMGGVLSKRITLEETGLYTLYSIHH